MDSKSDIIQDTVLRLIYVHCVDKYLTVVHPIDIITGELLHWYLLVKAVKSGILVYISMTVIVCQLSLLQVWFSGVTMVTDSVSEKMVMNITVDTTK